VQLNRSVPNRPVELVLETTIDYQHPGGTDTTYAITSVLVDPSANVLETFKVPVRPDLKNQTLVVSDHCGSGKRCNITNITVDYIACWDYSQRPQGRVDLGEPTITIKQ
jgi:hypothetical protein